MHRVTILRPLINEKSMSLVEASFYTFEVERDATKAQISKLVAEKFKVTPLSVKIINLHGKTKQQRSRKGYYQTAGSKKAIVKVKPGQKIALFEVAQPEEEVSVTTAEGEPIAKVKEKKSLLKGTKVKIEETKSASEKISEGQRGQKDLKTSHKEGKKKGAK